MPRGTERESRDPPTAIGSRSLRLQDWGGVYREIFCVLRFQVRAADGSALPEFAFSY